MIVDHRRGADSRSSLIIRRAVAGPQLCFAAGHNGVYPTATKNFPSLRFVEDTQDDFASLLQAYVELTQIMTSCHDILYPSKERTLSMITTGEYYKHLDEHTYVFASPRAHIRR